MTDIPMVYVFLVRDLTNDCLLSMLGSCRRCASRLLIQPCRRSSPRTAPAASVTTFTARSTATVWTGKAATSSGRLQMSCSSASLSLLVAEEQTGVHNSLKICAVQRRLTENHQNVSISLYLFDSLSVCLFSSVAIAVSV